MTASMHPSASDEPSEISVGASAEWIVRYFFIPAGILIGMGFYCLSTPEPAPQAWNMEHVNDVARYVLYRWAPFVLFPAGALLGLWGLRNLRRQMVADEQGLGYAGTPRLRWDQVQSIDASRLQAKGILYVLGPEDRKITLDSWKLNDFKKLVAFVEAHVPPQKIRGV